ncbi:hypothetical protein O181_106882 [Austropuccinia psidii MF-1]|uniref:Uncharacterized protein n=1 Tax=Austropuccinia psidii MF-1 TaxID=1389203 RepID=A0A9Q3JSW9_9BASI|nr:hypothetical protein [Austropuccinia psidii MF-1]
MEIDIGKDYRFSELEPEGGTPDSEDIDSKGAETPILGIRSSEIHNGFFSAVRKTYTKKTLWHMVATTSTEIQEPRTGIPVIGTLLEGL